MTDIGYEDITQIFVIVCFLMQNNQNASNLCENSCRIEFQFLYFKCWPQNRDQRPWKPSHTYFRSIWGEKPRI